MAGAITSIKRGTLQVTCIAKDCSEKLFRFHKRFGNSLFWGLIQKRGKSPLLRTCFLTYGIFAIGARITLSICCVSHCFNTLYAAESMGAPKKYVCLADFVQTIVSDCERAILRQVQTPERRFWTGNGRNGMAKTPLGNFRSWEN